MAAHRPQDNQPPIETIDSTIDSMIDETAPPQKSPLRGGALPFERGGQGGGGGFSPQGGAGFPHQGGGGFPPPGPQGSAGFAPPGAGFPPHNAQPGAGFPPHNAQHAPQRSTGEETAPAERSPLAAAMPFRHAKPSASTVAIPMLTPEEMQRLTGNPSGLPSGNPGGRASAPSGRTPTGAERAKLEQAKTVAFAMPPPGFGVPGGAAAAPPQQNVGHAPQSAFQHPQSGFPPPQGAFSPGPSPGHPPSPNMGTQGQSPIQSPVRTPSIPPVDGPVRAKSTGHFGLSIEQYAALCAEVSASPATAHATFTKYGLSERKDQLTADLAWQERLREDAALMQRWQSLYLYYHEYYHRTIKR